MAEATPSRLARDGSGLFRLDLLVSNVRLNAFQRLVQNFAAFTLGEGNCRFLPPEPVNRSQCCECRDDLHRKDRQRRSRSSR